MVQYPALSTALEGPCTLHYWTFLSPSSQVFFSNMDGLFPEYAEYDLIVPTHRSAQIMFWKSALTISSWCDFLVGLWDEPDSAWDGHIWYGGGEEEGRHKQRMFQSDMEVSCGARFLFQLCTRCCFGCTHMCWCLTNMCSNQSPEPFGDSFPNL